MTKLRKKGRSLSTQYGRGDNPNQKSAFLKLLESAGPSMRLKSRAGRKHPKS